MKLKTINMSGRGDISSQAILGKKKGGNLPQKGSNQGKE